MKKWKNKLCILLICALVLGGMVTACANDDEVEVPDVPDVDEAPPVTEDAPAPIEEQAGLTWMPTSRTTPPAHPAPVNSGVIVIGVDGHFQERWNPFMAESVYDNNVMRQIFSALATYTPDGVLIPHLAESLESEVVTIDGEDFTLYTITLRQGLVFSDGSPITIDDFIYGIYVRADPSFTGPGALIAGENLIVGLREYFYDDPYYAVRLAEFEAIAAPYALDVITLDLFMEYAVATEVGGWMEWDPVGWMEEEGFEDRVAEIDIDNHDEVLALFAEFIFTYYLDFHDPHGWVLEPLISEYALGNLEDGVTVAEISGITRIDDYTVTILHEGVHFDGMLGIAHFNGAGPIVSRYFYGPFEKGDVSPITSNMEPMVSSGPFLWGGFANNIVTVTSNPLYFEGVPATGTIRWQFVPREDIVTALISGQIDIAEPTASIPTLEELRAADDVEYHIVDNAGYFFLGFNVENVQLDVRRGIASLMNRAPAVEAYFGELAVVIERPMTTILAEYPHDAEEWFGYSLENALTFFEAAGYTQVNGVLQDADGNQLRHNIFIAAGGMGDHPAFPMIAQARDDMASLGGELIIQDVPFNVLQGAMDDGTADIFSLAWGDVFNADKTTQFHSRGGQNRYNFSSPRMDDLLERIVNELDLPARTALVAEMLDYAIDQVIEFPIYQRQNLFAYYTRYLDMSTMPERVTPFFNFNNVLWQLETRH